MGADGPGTPAPAGDGSHRRPSAGGRRIATIMSRIPDAREQLLVAMEKLGAGFELDALIAAAGSPDAEERNKVAVIEREVEVLINWLHELAARGLAEGRRLGAVGTSSEPPWEQLAELGVISSRTAGRLEEIRTMRNELGHAYPIVAWRTLHSATTTLIQELDPYLERFRDWATESSILPPPPTGSAGG